MRASTQRVRLSHERARNDGVSCIFDARESIDAVHIYEDRWSHQPHIEHGAKRLPAGDDARLLPLISKHTAGVTHCLWTDVTEGCRLHRLPSASAC